MKPFIAQSTTQTEDSKPVRLARIMLRKYTAKQPITRIVVSMALNCIVDPDPDMGKVMPVVFGEIKMSFFGSKKGQLGFPEMQQHLVNLGIILKVQLVYPNRYNLHSV